MDRFTKKKLQKLFVAALREQKNLNDKKAAEQREIGKNRQNAVDK